MYDFDRIIKRTGTNSLKYDFVKERMGRDDLLPLWVADMDFALPPEVLEPLQERVAHGIFGYSDPKEPYYKALSGWYERHHHWSINRRWNTVVPGVVYGIAQAILALTKPEDAILIMQPV
ncbi:MAG: aminotransferase, partial [Lachnospiraceae bacterium]|nr:aminotransferase [Lachnospiraceae bacterium]